MRLAGDMLMGTHGRVVKPLRPAGVAAIITLFFLKESNYNPNHAHFWSYASALCSLLLLMTGPDLSLLLQYLELLVKLVRFPQHDQYRQ